MAADPSSPVAVIGGSGFYTFLAECRDVEVSTPYGSPSAPIALGVVDGTAVAFLPRHGRHHEHPPHRINYRANLWALRSLGVRRVLAPCAAGSLQEQLLAGAVVVPDQLVDRTCARVDTYVERGAMHVGFADPYCPQLRTAVLEAAGTLGEPVVDGGTMVVVQGPRFSTRAESRWYAEQGWSLVNMTGHPEAVLARELALCYTPIALVTDLDAGLAAGGGVTQAEVFATFGQGVEALKELVRAAMAALSDDRRCPCAGVHDGIDVPFALP